MSDEKWYANKNAAFGCCDHCGKYNTEHAPWCINMNAAVGYAFTVVTKPQFMSQADHLALRGMGVKWVDEETMCLPAAAE
jgi:hypothetical protein